MKIVLIATLLGFEWVGLQAQSAPAPQLSLRHSAGNVELSWPGTVPGSGGSPVQPFFELQRSSDLRHWQPVGERMRATTAVGDAFLRTTVPASEGVGFYRLLSVPPVALAQLGMGGAEVFGYGAAYSNELQRIGQITPDQFAAMFPSGAQYLDHISWDPTTAEFWDRFNADPDVANQSKN